MLTVLVVVGGSAVSALVVCAASQMHTPMHKAVKNPFARKVSAVRHVWFCK